MQKLLPLLALLLLPLLALAQAPSPSSPSNPSTPSTSSTPSTPSFRITCVGNSITEGYALADPATEAYPARMQQILGDEFYVLNCGISSHTALNGTEFPYMRPNSKDRDPFHEALRSNPDIVTIKLGTNDSKTRYDSLMHADFTHDLLALVDTFQTLPSHPYIYLCLPVPATAERWSIRDSVIQSDIIPRILQVAAERHLAVIDLYSVFKPFPELLADNIHPNRAGAMLIAEEISRRIQLDIANGIVKRAADQE